MIENRIAAFRRLLEKQGLDSFIVLNPANRFYLSGFKGTAGVLLITLKECFLITDFRYIEQAKQEASSYQVIKYELSINATVNEIAQKLHIKKMGFEEDYITYSQYNNLHNELIQISLIATNQVTEEIRMIKDNEEINNIRKAAAIADEAFTHILNIIAPGKKETEIGLELEYYMLSKGASKTSFQTIVASGVRSALPHGTATEKIIEKGDFVTMDFGCIYNQYCSDMTRTIVVGTPSTKQKEIYNIVLKAQDLALEALKANCKTKDIDALSRGYIHEKGYGDNFGHGLGHSLGLDVHEKPSLSPKDSNILKNNMIVTVEPGIYIPGWGGVRIEDLVVVNETGIENLTHSPKDLIIL
ncbi:Xaa-Pro aminopeptidase [Desulfonispora thiosulfatigenes DSM 11270]|uniref:Xaa-Pro aminopeptidase n=1 Tax=Desulfonispora thiosulfatigenes DSM 11270 TaxID=656914 RepID=A0A1W1VNX0_DESTI|nr:Xaa-Pro peptidase family protein [Desulfonispora thiosulfatigenes]SMB94771.1 Xaa-Pro aminopeptidase [Desulfonispora thiosulfatigenes DSM 11270]